MEEQSSQGSFTPTGRMDILATAIGKPDHGGRVIGESGVVTLTRYFGRASQSSTQTQVSEELLSKLHKEIKAEVEASYEATFEARVQASVKAEVEATLDSRVETRVASLRDEFTSLLYSKLQQTNASGQVNLVLQLIDDIVL